MKRIVQELPAQAASDNADRSRLMLGSLLGVTCGRAVVDYPGNGSGPIEARSAVPLPPAFDMIHAVSIPLLLFVDGNKSVPPIIVAVLLDSSVSLDAQPGPGRPTDIILDGSRMIFTADKEIVLRCGKSSICLRSDGRIVIKGANLTSRASGTNKVKGATVKMN